MVRKLAFWWSSLEQNLLGTVPFSLFLTAIRFYTDFSFYIFEVNCLGLVTFLWLCFQMNMDDYPHFFLAKDRKLCAMGQHCPGFPRVLYNALLHLSYDREVPIYHCRLSMVDGLDICDTSVMIHLNQEDPWMGTIAGSEPNTTVEQTAHVALTSLCQSHLAATAAMPIALFMIRNKENPMWKQCLEAVSDLKGPHFSTDMAAMAKYVQYLFNLQLNTIRIVM
jgi:hypothetical protein